jgi:hypothetical protein
VEALLRLGADVRRRYHGLLPRVPGRRPAERHPAVAMAGATALHDAADGGYAATCAALLRGGAAAHAADADGLTALGRAMGRATEDDAEDAWRAAVDVLRRWEEGDVDEGGAVGGVPVHEEAGSWDAESGRGWTQPLNYNGRAATPLYDRRQSRRAWGGGGGGGGGGNG